MESKFFDRDISWLSFNERVLNEAGSATLPLAERVNFLAIFSSNLDEFYRVRIPALKALNKIDKTKDFEGRLNKIQEIIDRQQTLFGQILNDIREPLSKDFGITWIYNQLIPSELKSDIDHYFFTQVMAFLQPVCVTNDCGFFPENNKPYLAVSFLKGGQKNMMIIKIPSDFLGRFFSLDKGDQRFILFLDDIIADHLSDIFPGGTEYSCHSFKITRDAELELDDEYEGDLAQKIEKQLLKRDMGYATRFLYDQSIPEADLQHLVDVLNLKRASHSLGGRYHNLRDLFSLPLPTKPGLRQAKWPAIKFPVQDSIFETMDKGDFVISPPYLDYDTVLRFFNEAAIDPDVSEVYTTIYRMANDSHIAQALISAAKNGKKVMVFVELKARFDEANNIRWAKKMKKAGVEIIYSIPGWKVHAKVALAKRREAHNRLVYYGILGTGNFNERTAKVYADHILFTKRKEMLRELELLFLFLEKGRRIEHNPFGLEFNELWVAQFNLLPSILNLIDQEIKNAKANKPASIILKMNNLEERVLIKRLYEASQAGVKIQMIVRGICCLIPGVLGMSENITIRRIVDRYLEHTRIFVFNNGGDTIMYAGSSDWMKRNIRRRIEVCFPIHDPNVKAQLMKTLDLDLADNTQAVMLNEQLENVPVENGDPLVRAQEAIYNYFKAIEK